MYTFETLTSVNPDTQRHIPEDRAVNNHSVYVSNLT